MKIGTDCFSKEKTHHKNWVQTNACFPHFNSWEEMFYQVAFKAFNCAHTLAYKQAVNSIWWLFKHWCLKSHFTFEVPFHFPLTKPKYLYHKVWEIIKIPFFMFLKNIFFLCSGFLVKLRKTRPTIMYFSIQKTAFNFL